MILQKTKIYLLSVRDLFISNDIVLSIIFLLEFLPILNNTTLRCFKLSGNVKPKTFSDIISYFSYYDQFRNLFDGDYPIYLLYCILFFPFLYLSYKYFALNFKWFKENILLKKIMLNLIELCIFRLFTIIFFDLAIHKIMKGSETEVFFGVIIFGLLFLLNFYHFNLHHFYIAIHPIRVFSFDNQIMLILDKYFLIIKALICFAKYDTNSKYLDLFLNLSIFIMNIVLFLHITYIVNIYKYCYLSKKWSIFTRITCVFLNPIFEIYIVLVKYQNSIICFFAFLNTIGFSSYLCYLYHLISASKMTKNGNELGSIYFLINECDSPNIKRYISTIVFNHRTCCKTDKCYMCHKIKVKNLENNISTIKLCYLLLKYLKKQNPHVSPNEIIDFFGMLQIVELFLLYLSDKSLIKIVLKYNRIKTLVKNDRSNLQNKTASLYHNLPTTFVVNYELLFAEIKQKIIDKNLNPKFKYLINMDLIILNIDEFFTELSSFVSLELKAPKEVIILAEKYASLTSKVDIDFLTTKDNRYNYSCVIIGYIMEEIFNDKITKNISFIDFVHTIDDVLTYHFKENKIILLLYDISTFTITIDICGKDLIEYKGKTFESIFPEQIRKEGKTKFVKTLEKKADNHFEYYFFDKAKGTIEVFTMGFFGIPSINQRDSLLNIICNYKIEKKNILFFQNKVFNYDKKQVLLMISDSLAHQLKISPKDISNGCDNNSFIFGSDIFGKKEGINSISLQKTIETKLNISHLKNPMIRQFESNFLEKINEYEFYNLTEIKQNNETSIKMTKELDSSAQEKEGKNEVDNYYATTQPGICSSNYSQSSLSSYNRTVISMKEEQNIKYKQFFKFTYYLISFNIVILLTIIFFLIIELLNNSTLEKSYNVITNYYDFQNHFYITFLSIFCLTCNAKSIDEINCQNSFLLFSQNFIEEYDLTENELLTDYISRELIIKANMVISSLKEWESDNDMIKSKEKDEILNKLFDFTIIESVGTEITVNTVNVSFEDAVKRFSNNIHIITSSEDYLTSPMYPISSDGYGNVDLSNAQLNKTVNSEGTYLSETQKLYYTMILNFQKYILRLLSIGDVIYEYFQKKIDSTDTQILVFLLLLIVLHLLMMLMCFIFVFKFKEMHMSFFIRVYQKINDKDFIEYYKKKVSFLKDLLDLYKDSPMTIITKIMKLKQKEFAKKQKENKMTTQEKADLLLKRNMEGETKINYVLLNTTYAKIYLVRLFFQISCLFGLYFIICIVFFVFIRQSLNHLSLMSQYTKYNYDLSNKIYIGTGLIQIMSFTNQTDEMLYEYFTQDESDKSSDNKQYVRDITESAFTLILDIFKMENNYDFFPPVTELIDFNCLTLYDDLQDIFINQMVSTYPDSNYYALFRAFCKSFQPIEIYGDPKLSVMYVTYQLSQLLDKFIDREYSTYATINNSDLIYQIYTEILMLIRPLRQFVYSNISNSIIKTIITEYNLVIIAFLVFNFVYETIILFIVKFHIINGIIRSAKQVINLAQALECFS